MNQQAPVVPRPSDEAAVPGDTSPARPVILEFPGGGDSYTDLFCPALAAQGATVVPGVYSGRWLLKNLRDADFVHIHWPSFLYADHSALATLHKAARLTAFLLLIRAFGVRIIWTAHNLYPHERNSPRWIDYAMRRLVVWLSYRVLVHGRTAAAIVREEFGIRPDKLVCIHHGHYVGRYPMDVSREQARQRLGLPADASVFAFVGHCRRYKNVTELIDTFQKHFPDSWLIIAGRCADRAYQAEIEARIRANPRGILFEPRFIDDGELQYFLRAADAVVLPFLDILTSGSAILALSFGRPVVAPRRGNLIDIVNDEMGVLYDPDDPAGLPKAMRAALERRFDQDRIMKYATAWRWDETAAKVLAALQGTSK